MNINEEFPSKYLKAADLHGRSFVLTISDVTREQMGGENKVIIYFRGKEKGMVLNKTNAFTISAIYGPETNNWLNQPIEVFTAMTTFQGQQMPALRVKAPAHQSQHDNIAPNAAARSHAAPDDYNPPAPLPDELDSDIPF